MTTVALWVIGVAASLLLVTLSSAAIGLVRRGHRAYGLLAACWGWGIVAADLAFVAVLSDHLAPAAGRRIAVSVSLAVALVTVLMARLLVPDWVELCLEAFLLAASGALIGLSVAIMSLPADQRVGTDAYSFYVCSAGFSLALLVQLQRRLSGPRRADARLLLGGAGVRVAGAAGLMIAGISRDLPVDAVVLVLAAAYVLFTVASVRLRHAPPTRAAPTPPRLVSNAPYLLVVVTAPVVLIGLVTQERLRHGFVLALYSSLAVALCVRQILTSNANKRLLSRLEDGERLYRSLVQNSGDVTMIASPEGRLEYVSPAAQRVFGEPAEALVGGQLADVLGVAPAAVSAATARLLATGAAERLESRRHDGRRMALESVLTRQDDRVLVSVRDVSDQAELRQQLRVLAYTDELTGLANWHRMHEEITAALDRTVPAGALREPALLFVDLDRFKSVNDAAGHAAGDAVLRVVAQRLRTAIPDDGSLARVGGDEFVVLLPTSTRTEREQVADDIARVMAVPCETDHGPFAIGASVGIAAATGARDADDLLRHADLAMYAAKSGFHAWHTYVPQLHDQAVARAEQDRLYLAALDHHAMAVVYQPVVDIVTGRTVACEALLRRRGEDGVLGPPTGLLEFAARTGRMHELSVWVLRAALDAAARWRDAGASVPVAVNLSSRDVLHPGLARLVHGELASRDLAASALSLEITEQLLLGDPEAAMKVCEELRALGVILAIDDFGTGFSSLAYLVDLPLDALKIDQSFIHAITRGGSSGVIVEAIVRMARELGLYVVAEGIETEQQRRLTAAAGVRFGQGYLFAGTLSGDRMGERLVVEAAGGPTVPYWWRAGLAIDAPGARPAP